MKRQRSTLLVAIVGGSGSGKSLLAKQLQAALGRNAARIVLDDFYRDRSSVPLTRRSRLNYDHPRSIDWDCAERALDDVSNGRPTPLPRYDFKTHCRMNRIAHLRPKPVALVDGLWLLLRRSLRRRFAMSIFIRCDPRTRLKRRLTRDCHSRGRTAQSVREQFTSCVEPMHARFVVPQERWADVILKGDFGAREVQYLTRRLRARLEHSTAKPREPSRRSRSRRNKSTSHQHSNK